MAGIIRREDIDRVRQEARIEEIVGEHVTLRPAGVDSMKGLCPFHDERTPSFHVRPQLGLWHCFGCGEGGDVIAFVQKNDHLEFAEAVEYLARTVGITLRYEHGRAPKKREDLGSRARLLDIHRNAEQFYRQQLASPEAQAGRDFLSGRGFDAEIAAHFSVGYSPPGWDSLTRHLRSQGFTDVELTTSGLSVDGKRGLYDRFRDRLMWPIRNLTGETIGFGARRLNEDPNSPKYLNTPETPIYHKAKVLYGLDLAKREIVRRKRVVVVEGYTDVMAAHVAGETTAVASCGTAFGSDHVQVVRRLLGDGADPAAGVILASGKVRGGEVIFTFDGDEAGRNAARKVFVEDQKFAAQTFVAVEPHGWDPCDLRLERGDIAVRQLVDSRIPLFEFVLRSVTGELNLATAEGRVTALRAGAPVLAGIKDVALRGEYIRQFAGWIGIDVAAVRRATSEVTAGKRRSGRPVAAPEVSADPVVRLERQALEALIQRPLDMVGSGYEELGSDAYTVPTHRAVHEAIQAVGGLERFLDFLGEAETSLGVGDQAVIQATRKWNEEIRSGTDPLISAVMTQMAVAPLPQDEVTGIRDYALGLMRALVRMGLTRQLASLRMRLKQLDPDDSEYESLFTQLVQLDQRRRDFSDFSA